MGNIFAIKRFEIHDGDGIRTTLFLKGCPLNCKWCHNPEGILPDPVVSYTESKCINCGECATVCDGHKIIDGRHYFVRTLCKSCGRCAEVCLGEALKLYGKEVSADEVIPLLLEDREFYKNSGGGVTLSGGEPLLQADFCRELLKKVKQHNINTAVDTCGYAKTGDIDKIIDCTDTFLYDIKAIDDEVHINCTGVSNKIILENIKYINSKNKDIEVRIPLVPGLNDDQIPKIGEFLRDLRQVKKIKVLPYHAYAKSKYLSLGLPYPLPDCRPPSRHDTDKAVEILAKYGLNAVNGAAKHPERI